MGSNLLRGSAVPESETWSRIVDALEAAPAAFARMAEGLTAEEIRFKPSPESFSVLEHICHLRDLEREGYTARIRRLIVETAPFLPDFDGDAAASERDYNRQSFQAALYAFSEARKRNVERLRSLPAETLARRGTLEGSGPITLSDLTVKMAEHDASHREELVALRDELKRR